MTTSENSREYDQLYNLARKAGLKLLKSRSPWIVANFGGYWLADRELNCAVIGHEPNIGMLDAYEVRSICENELIEA